MRANENVTLRGEHRERLSALPGLNEWCEANGYSLNEKSWNEVGLTEKEGGSWLSIVRIEDWMQVRAVFFEDVNSSSVPLFATLLRLQFRLLGCRFALDEDNNLWIATDLFPHEQSAAAIGAAVDQIQSIVDSTYDLLERVAETGTPATEEDFDSAFELRSDGQLH